MPEVTRACDPLSAAEERELRAIAREALKEALEVGNACRTFRGHRIRADRWILSRGFFVRCTLDGHVLYQCANWATPLPDTDHPSG